jgi:hypothetical protein
VKKFSLPEIFPLHRVVAFYGAPQDVRLGILGEGTPADAGCKLLHYAGHYARHGKPVVPAFNLIATIAQAGPGSDGKHRRRQSDDVLERYLATAHQIRGLLLLDVQPGKSDFLEEALALEPYLQHADVGLGLDPEWNFPRAQVGGQKVGCVEAEAVNEVSAYLSDLVSQERLPQKLLVVHQFMRDMVRNREAILERPGVSIVFDMDGFGTPELKIEVYEALAWQNNAGSQANHRNGIKLFLNRDTDLMDPADVLALRPQPDIVIYG